MSADADHAADATGWVRTSTPAEWSRRALAGGPDHVVADCGSPESHELRLRAVLHLPFRTGDTLVELGCGTGRLADLLPSEVSYQGIDWSPAVIDEARARRPAVRFNVGVEDDLPAADWVVASGPFNYRAGWSKQRTTNAIQKMWRASRVGIAVTALRTPAPNRLHYQPGELLGMVEGLDWSELQVDRSYLPNDICLSAWRTR